MQYMQGYGSHKELAQKMMEYKNSDIAKIIDEYVHNERHRAILKRRYMDGICYEPLSEEFGLSVRQTKNIIYKYENIILGKLKRS